MLRKRHSKKYFSDVLDDLKRSFSVQQQRRFDFVSKKCFINSRTEIRGLSRTAAVIQDGELRSDNKQLLAVSYYCKFLNSSSKNLSLFQAKRKVCLVVNGSLVRRPDMHQRVLKIRQMFHL